MCTDEGENLLDPGETPHENMQFLLFLAAILRAVDEHADLLRLSASTPGNDHRLGANEAPPAIISVFLGEQLGNNGEATEGEEFSRHSLHISRKMLQINKFEFRMVGSTQSIADPNTVLNTIVAEVLCDMATNLPMALHDRYNRRENHFQR